MDIYQQRPSTITYSYLADVYFQYSLHETPSGLHSVDRFKTALANPLKVHKSKLNQKCMICENI